MDILDNDFLIYLPGNGKTSRMSILNEVMSNKFLYENLAKKVIKEYDDNKSFEFSKNKQELTKINDNIWKKLNDLEVISLY